MLHISVFSQIDQYAPGFSESIVGYECLPPPELERIFGLTGGVSIHVFSKLDITLKRKKTVNKFVA